MEIRHRKQWLTGKMIAQVRLFDLWPWVDATEDSFKNERKGGSPPPRPIPDSYGYQPTVGQDNGDIPPPPFPKFTNQVKEKEFSRTLTEALIDWEVIELRQDKKEWLKERASLLTKVANEMELKVRALGEIEALRTQLSESQDKLREYREEIDYLRKLVEQLKQTTAVSIDDRVRRVEVHMRMANRYAKELSKKLADPNSDLSKAMAKSLGVFQDLKIPEFNNAPVEQGDSKTPAKPFLNPQDAAAQPIPHHGPGLSEAEDAMRCDTYIPGKGGIAGTGRRLAGMVGKDEPIFNLGRLKMPPFNLLPERPADSKDDPINPSHYKRGGLEAIDVIRAATADLTGEEAYCTGNAIKYLFRWKEKGGKTDLSKARWYINRMLGDE